MNWDEKYNEYKKPTHEEIKLFLGETGEFWEDITSHIEKAYKVKPEMVFHSRKVRPGWNVKYKKSGKSLCIFYPMEGYFLALIVIGQKEEEKIGYAIENEMLTPYIKDLIQNTPSSEGGRLLKIEVKDKDIVKDLKTLISIRVKA